MGCSSASGQYYSLAEGYGLADSLYANDLLSAAGRDELRQGITGGSLPVYASTQSAVPGYTDSVSAGQVLSFLYQAYQSAYFYRQGALVEAEVLQEEGITDPGKLTNTQRQQLAESVQERIEAIPGREAERVAAASLSPNKVAPRTLGMANRYFPTPLTDVLIPAGRSSFGYTVDSTLQLLARLELISGKDLEEARRKIEQFGLLPDFSPLQDLAHAAGEQEITRIRMRQRREAIQWLVRYDLLEGSVAEKLVADTVLLQSDNRRDLYTYLRPQFSVTLVAPPTLNALFDQFSRELCGVDSRFCQLAVTAAPIAAYGRASAGENRHFSLVGSDGDSVFYTGPDLFIPPPESPLSEWSGTYMLDQLAAPYNALLRRENADYRLYFLSSAEQQDAGTLVLGVFPLTSVQARALSDPTFTEVAGGLQGPDAREFLSPVEATEIRDSLEALHFFRSLPPEQARAGKACAETRGLEGLRDFFACYPSLYLPVSENGAAADLSGTHRLRELPGRYYRFLPKPFEQSPIYLKLEDGVADFLERWFPGRWQSLP